MQHGGADDRRRSIKKGAGAPGVNDHLSVSLFTIKLALLGQSDRIFLQRHSRSNQAHR
jgi:hypothetical protein